MVFSRPKPSDWDLRPGDLPSRREIDREPKLWGLEDNAVFRFMAFRMRRMSWWAMKPKPSPAPRRLRLAERTLARLTLIFPEELSASALSVGEIGCGILGGFWLQARYLRRRNLRLGCVPIAAYLLACATGMRVPSPLMIFGGVLTGACMLISLFADYVIFGGKFQAVHAVRLWIESPSRLLIWMLIQLGRMLLIQAIWFALVFSLLVGSAPITEFIRRQTPPGIMPHFPEPMSLVAACFLAGGLLAGACLGLMMLAWFYRDPTRRHARLTEDVAFLLDAARGERDKARA